MKNKKKLIHETDWLLLNNFTFIFFDILSIFSNMEVLHMSETSLSIFRIAVDYKVEQSQRIQTELINFLNKFKTANTQIKQKNSSGV